MLEDEPEKVPDSAALLEQLRDILEAARKLPMSASVSINRDEFGAILQDAIDGLPEELRERVPETNVNSNNGLFGRFFKRSAFAANTHS